MKNENNYLEDLKTYQEKQYLPGYYVGGTIPPEFRYPTKAFGYFLLLGGLFGLGLIYFQIFTNGFELSTLFGLLLEILILLAGIQILVKNKKTSKR